MNGNAPDATQQYAQALRDMTRRYELLVQGYSILRQLDAIDDPDLDLQEVCLRLLDAIAGCLMPENCSLMLLTEDRQHLELRAATSALDDQGVFYAPGFWSGKRFRIGEGILGQVALTGKHQRVADIKAEDQFLTVADSQIDIRSLMCFPLKIEDGVIGVLNMSHSEPDFFSIDSEQVASLVVNRSARLVASHIVHQRRRQSENQFRLVCRNAGDAILVFDRAGRVVSANPAVAELTGYPEDRLTKGDAHWDEGIVFEDRERHADYRARITASLCRETVEYAYKDAKGVIHHLEERSSPVHDRAGRYSGFVSVVRDVTDRKRSEEERRDLETQLRHAQKMEAVGKLAGGVAHDFNNLLTGIIGNVSLARSIEDVHESASLLEEAEKAAKRAAGVVKQLLVFSRRTTIDKRPTDVGIILDEVATIIHSTFDRRIEIAIEKDPDLYPVIADGGQIHQVLLNLCVNARDALLEAVKADSERPLRLTIRGHRTSLTAEDCKGNPNASPGDYVRLRVTDTGTGMDATTMGHAFEPFFTTKARVGGTGLGLAIVYGIIEQHDGWVMIESEPGVGTTVTFYLRVAEELDHPRPQARPFLCFPERRRDRPPRR